MSIQSRKLSVVLAFLVLGLSVSFAAPKDDFSRWEPDIKAFEKADQENPPEPGGILFLGSSSIRMWDLKKWFPELDALNRGFGGSQIADSIHFADRIVFPYAPRLIVFYAGDNDVAVGKDAARVASDFETLTAKVWEKLPDTPIIYIAIKPSIARWKLVDEMRSANGKIKAYCEEKDRLAFVDIDTPMIGEDGKPRPELFLEDGLHLNDAGYALWTRLVMPHLKQEKEDDGEG